MSVAGLTVALTACDGPQRVNPPTEPALPVQGPGTSAAPPPRPPGMEPLMRGAGAASFIGRWAAAADWCANPRGDRVPIEITTTELRGYENRCAIVSIDERGMGYDAVLDCEAEGASSRERVRFEATEETLRLTWLDQGTALPVRLIRCTSLAN
ncbi:hypothetical protein D8I30_00620 [Brevundimonas naejangsanensis]|uniref:Uncharacterized protein n=1 Tax=Brevundimonas naejangsanensis TaxID=588932 RepID=A0A494RC21_9CAUL|nr:hypothetical protein D8I30_00620 [Brevundimonas naejangsanensis]